MSEQFIDIPLIINGKEVYTDNYGSCVQPHNHQKVLAKYYKAGEHEAKKAIEASLESWKKLV